MKMTQEWRKLIKMVKENRDSKRQNYSYYATILGSLEIYTDAQILLP